MLLKNIKKKGKKAQGIEAFCHPHAIMLVSNISEINLSPMFKLLEVFIVESFFCMQGPNHFQD